MGKSELLHDVAQPTIRSRRKRAIVLLIGLLVVYPLSVGPATWMLHHWVDVHSPLWSAYISFYTPLVNVTTLNETLATAFTEYLTFWVPELIDSIHG